MNLSNEEYKKYAEGRAKKSPIVKDCIWAFFTGGAICTVGHGLKQMYTYFGVGTDNAGMLASVTIVFAAVLLTGLGVFDDIAKHAGAGTLVPITGFANAVSSCAIDTKSDECDIIGLSRKAP